MRKILIGLVIIFGTIVLSSSMKNKSNDKDFVPDEKTAIKVAEAIWLPIYGEDIYSQIPFVAQLINDKYWVVTGTLHTTKGGVAYIKIRKNDCKIIKVTHGK